MTAPLPLTVFDALVFLLAVRRRRPFGGVDRGLLVVVVACLVAGLLETYRQSMSPRLTPTAVVVTLLLPFSAACFGWAIARSVYLAEARGVRWRGTTYPLSLLRAQSGLEGTAANRSR